MSPKKANGCGCSSVPILLYIIIFGGGYWFYTHFLGNFDKNIKPPELKQFEREIPFQNRLSTKGV